MRDFQAALSLSITFHALTCVSRVNLIISSTLIFLSFVDDPRFPDDHISSSDKGRRPQERSQLLFSLSGNRYFSSIFVYSDDHPRRGFDTAAKKTASKRYLDFICIVHQIQSDM